MTDYLLDLLKQQSENDFMTGGIAMMVFGAILAVMRNTPGQLWRWTKRRFITTVDVTDHDPAYFWIQKWLSQQEYTKKRARLLTVSTRMKPNQNPNEDPSGVGGRVEVIFSPAPGMHVFRFNGSWLLLNKSRREVDNGGFTAYRETITFQTFSRDVVRDLIYEAREVAFPPEEETVGVYRPHGWSWALVHKKLPRDLNSVVLADGLADDIIDDVRDFFSSRQLYLDLGVPYQRGYLLTGPPGTGKTSLVTAIASKFRRDIYMINLSAVGDEQLINIMSQVPEQGVVLIEDMDCSYNLRERTKDSSLLTFSGLLNALDGITAPSGRMLFMTSNHPEKLDPAIKRPGRADRTFKLGFATAGQACRMYLRFFPDEVGLAEAFADAVHVGGDVTTATLQEHLLTRRHDCEAASLFGESCKLTAVVCP